MENVEGRVVLDILRHVLTACNLSSFSLVDCCQSLLGRRLEVLPASAATSLSKGTAGSARPALTLLDPFLRSCRRQGSVFAMQLTAHFASCSIAVHGPAVDTHPDEASQVPAGVREQVCDTMRLAAYAAERANVVRALLQRMATLPEAIEIGRVTGLTLGQARTSYLWLPGMSSSHHKT